MEYLIAIIIVSLTVIYFLFLRKKEEPKPKCKKENKTKETPAPVKKEEEKKTIDIDTSKIVDNKALLISSFREGKDMRNPLITHDGKTILFHDDKKISLCFLTNLEEKTQKFISKNVEQDVISDASYSEEKR